ncbi:MAG: hypothetical protein JO339_25005 [Alphaproteobacteria bacterium]|nr:hypothetical protein [Alphaproteobacteria bacterium]
MTLDTTFHDPGQRIARNRARRFPDARTIVVAAMCLLVGPGLARVDNGWEIQETPGQPAFATAIPSGTNLDIASVVLACERGDDGGVLQLQLYPTGADASLRAIGPPVWSYGRVAEIKIDQKVFPANVLFGDDYVVIADQSRGRFPMLSEALLDAMATGRTMSLRIPRGIETISVNHGVDGYAKVDLQAGQGSKAVAVLRRCSAPARVTK